MYRGLLVITFALEDCGYQSLNLYQSNDPSYKNDYVGKEWKGKRQVITKEGEDSGVGDDDEGTTYGEKQMSGGAHG